MMFTFLAAEGHKVGSSLLEAGPARHGQAATSRRRRSGASSSCCPIDAVVAASLLGAMPSTSSTRADPRSKTRRSAHPASASTSVPRRPTQFADVDPRLEDGVLERPDGRVRDGGVRGRHQGGRAGAHRGRRPVASSAAATPPPRCASSGSPTTSSVTSRPAAARASSSSRARSSPDWRSSDGSMQLGTRTPLIAGNWKMNLDHLQAVAFVQKLHWTLKDAKHEDGSVEVAVFPPFTDLRTVQTLLDADKIPFALGAQDISSHGLRRLHRRGLGRVPREARQPLRHHRPLRAPRVPRTRATRSWPRRCRRRFGTGSCR